MKGLKECSILLLGLTVTGSGRLIFSGEANSCIKHSERKTGLGHVEFPLLPFGTCIVRGKGVGGDVK